MNTARYALRSTEREFGVRGLSGVLICGPTVGLQYVKIESVSASAVQEARSPQQGASKCARLPSSLTRPRARAFRATGQPYKRRSRFFVNSAWMPRRLNLAGRGRLSG